MGPLRRQLGAFPALLGSSGANLGRVGWLLASLWFYGILRGVILCPVSSEVLSSVG